MGSKFHAFMYPYFALGHMIPYLHLANKLAEKGHRITFLLPKKAQKQLESLNLFPNSIVFHPLTLPLVEGLPVGAETASDLSPQGNPSSKVALRGHEANLYSLFTNTCQRLLVRITTGIRNCDVVSIRTCAEIEGKYCSFIERECQKKVLLTGPVFPEPQEKSVKPLEDRWNH